MQQQAGELAYLICRAALPAQNSFYENFCIVAIYN